MEESTTRPPRLRRLQVIEEALRTRIRIPFENEPHRAELADDDSSGDDDPDRKSAPVKVEGPGDRLVCGARVSPDGLCFLASSGGQRVMPVLHMFEVNEKRDNARPVLEIGTGEFAYDFQWYPMMHSHYPATCCFVSTARDHPVILWDAYTGQRRATYAGLDPDGETQASALCVQFTPSGQFLLAGYHESVAVFDVNRPGLATEYHSTVPRAARRRRGSSKGRGTGPGQRGLVSCLAVCPDGSDCYVAGSFLGGVVLYSPDGSAVSELAGTGKTGVTHLQFSPDGRFVFAGSRRSGDIVCWDVRNPSAPVGTLSRPCSTNQRIRFSVHSSGRWLVTGASDGAARLFDLSDSFQAPSLKIESVDGAAVNAADFFPSATGDGCATVLLATGSRPQRRVALPSGSSSDSDEDDGSGRRPRASCLELWSVELSGAPSPQPAAPDQPAVAE